MRIISCPECGTGGMQEITVSEYSTKLRGVPISIKDAKIWVCPICQEQAFSAKEIERWERLFEGQHESITPTMIKELQVSSGYNVSEFAILLGITRQTFHAWTKRGVGVKFGPAALLLKILYEQEVLGLTGSALSHLKQQKQKSTN